MAGRALPATGGETPSVFVLVSATSGVLLLLVLRRARRHPA
ncbi:MAG: LPXTG cell wall anchor domain-containing protein [Acidimicrobiales bacterium]